MRTIARLILGLAGLAALRALSRIARRSTDPQGIPGAAELMWLLVYVLAAPAITKNTPKTNATKARVDNLVAAVGTTNATVAGIQTQLTGNTGFASANGYGATSTANVGTTSAPDAGDLQSGLSTSGQVGGAAAHTHTLPFLLPNADHTHDFGGHTHDFGGHNHPL